MPKKEEIGTSLPRLSRGEIQKLRHDNHAKRSKKLHELGEERMKQIHKVAEEHYTDVDLLQSTPRLAKELAKMEEAIKKGNKEAVALKENVIRAKTKMEEVIKKYDERHAKIIAEFKKNEEELDVMDKIWRDKAIQERYEDMERRRATSQEVDLLATKFHALEQEVAKYRLDRHLVAQMENLKAENAVIKQQIQKIFQILKSEGMGR